MPQERFSDKPFTFKCSLNTSEMEPTEQGFMCMYCANEVVDFRKKSKEDFVEMKSKNPSLCGIYYDYQIEGVVNRDSIWKPVLRASAFLAILGIAPNAMSQNLSDTTSSVQDTSEIAVEGPVLTMGDPHCAENKTDNLTRKEKRGERRAVLGPRKLFTSSRFPFIHYKRRHRIIMGFW